MKKIKVYKKFYWHKHYCDQCMKPLHRLWVRETPRTLHRYCEGCAIDKRLLPR